MHDIRRLLREAGRRISGIVAEIRTRHASASQRARINPMILVLVQIGARPDSLESQVMRRACLGLLRGESRITTSELYALDRESRRLLNDFASWHKRGDFLRADVECFQRKVCEIRPGDPLLERLRKALRILEMS